jgi:hypothetical protein
MQGIQWTDSPFAQIRIQEFATNFYQGWFPCCAIVINLLAYVYIALWLNATTRQVFIIQSPRANASHISSRIYVKPGMSQTPKLWFHVLERISNVMNI